MHSYIEHVNPYLGKRLVEIGLNKQYIRGEGCYLFDREDNKYLDFIAAYGALPFGYNPPEIWQAITNIRDAQEPSFVQPSLLDAAGELAKRLIEVCPSGMQYVTFTNSGTEAAEAAIKLCRSKTGKLGILSTTNSFHGKTLGALSATGNEGYQKAFGAPVSGFSFIPYGDVEALRQQLEQNASNIGAFIVEPIQGEGGIVEPPEGYLGQVQTLCAQFGVLTIFDEIQTGLGRTGSLFVCAAEGVTPDVLLVAKALGGGIVPIGAMICTAETYTEDFGLKHSSTFAGNSLGARVGLAVLDLLTKENGKMTAEIARKGKLLKDGLLKIQKKYPGIIRRVRGRGLMLGLDFGNSKSVYPHSLLGVMAEQEILTPIIASYLLNTEKLRVAPTLNGASVIRIEPPLNVTDEQIEHALSCVERATQMLAKRNTAACLGHLVGYNRKDELLTDDLMPENPIEVSGEDGRFAFLIHPVDLNNYSDFDSSLRVFTQPQLLDLCSRWNDMVEPFVVSRAKIQSQCGNTAVGDFICVPRTAKQMLEMPREQAVAEIAQAVELAESRGAKLVGLGAYTSVVTVGGRSLLSKANAAITTGNSYTVVSGVESVLIGAKKLGMELSKITAAVVGAGGAIGKASAVLFSEEVRELILIGNPEAPSKSERRMLKVTVEILKHVQNLTSKGRRFAEGTLAGYIGKLQNLPAADGEMADWLEAARELIANGLPVTISVDSRKWLPEADVILVATSSPDTLITSQMLKWGALVCDMSRPTNVGKEVLESREDVLVIDGGVIEVPNRPDLGWNFGFDRGLAYACMSETMMLGLEQRYENTSIGADLNLEHLTDLRELAKKHGFSLAGFRSFDRPIDDEVWNRVKAVRHSEIANERGA